MEHGLTPREVKFCRAFVANGGNGKAAAIEAGIPAAGAAVQATRLLKRADIQAEIAAIRASPRGVTQAVISKALAVINEARPSPSGDPDRAAMHAEADKDIAAGLTRAYIVAGLMENFEMALGRRPKKVTRFIKEKRVDAEGQIVTETVAMQETIFEVDHAGANRAGELLLQQCAPDAPENPQGDTPAGNVVSPLLEAFKAGRVFEVHPEKAKEAR